MDALEYNKRLVSFESTSNLSNAPVSDYCEEVLSDLGFAIERIEYEDPDGVRKVSVLGKKGEGTGGMAYFAHTDVVPADPWHTDDFGPFEPSIVGDRLYGRGSCDMKGSIACMFAAAERLADLPHGGGHQVVPTAVGAAARRLPAADVQPVAGAGHGDVQQAPVFALDSQPGVRVQAPA